VAKGGGRAKLESPEISASRTQWLARLEKFRAFVHVEQAQLQVEHGLASHAENAPAR
jgi:hypothetical protein